MLNSCASNVVVVNIDAGFNGGHMAGLIARRMGQARESGVAGGPVVEPNEAAVAGQITTLDRASTNGPSE